MKNKRFLYGLVSSVLVVSFCGMVYAAQPAASTRTTNTNTLQPAGVTTKPTQPTVTNVGGSMTPCSNYCDKGMMVEQKVGAGGCKQISTSSCFPYTCNYQGTLCHSSCTGNVQCATPNAYCNMTTKQCMAGNNCPSKCEGDNKVEYVPSAMMPNSSTCKKDKTSSCYPYNCDPQTGACRNNCSADQQCATGAMCDTGKKSCVPAYNHCDKDNPNYLILVDRTKVQCNPYMCRGNACLTNCDVSTDCIKGFVCDTMAGRACIPIQ
jgi:hypothetical protein